MIGKYRMRTDLAMENQEKFERDHVEISGVEIEKKKKKGGNSDNHCENHIGAGCKNDGKAERDVCDDRSAAAFDGRRGGEPESSGGVFPLSDGNGAGSVRIRSCGRPWQPRHHAGCARAGDGGAANVTRHLVRTYGKKGREVSALAPGVMAQTGMEAVEILRGTAEQTHPDVILAVDALAACSIHRLNCTIQLADTGIWPGSGVGNHRNALNQETLGVPVIGIGVPTVVGAGTIVHDAVAGVLESLEESEMDEFLGEVISPALESLYVTTKEIDEMVRRLAGVLAAGMNQAFSGEL